MTFLLYIFCAACNLKVGKWHDEGGHCAICHLFVVRRTNNWVSYSRQKVSRNAIVRHGSELSSSAGCLAGEIFKLYAWSESLVQRQHRDWPSVFSPPPYVQCLQTKLDLFYTP
jgi:hypothetical protein